MELFEDVEDACLFTLGSALEEVSTACVCQVGQGCRGLVCCWKSAYPQWKFLPLVHSGSRCKLVYRKEMESEAKHFKGTLSWQYENCNLKTKQSYLDI